MAQVNGFHTPPQSPSASMGGSTRRSTYMTSSTFSSSRSQSNGYQQSTVVRDTAIALKRKSASQLGAGISSTTESVGFIDLVQWIRAERLQTLPHKGSKWDSVLIRALYFAERIHGFEIALKSHALETEQAGHVGYGHMKVLLELGHENSAALDKAFSFMHRCSVAVTAVLARAEVLTLSAEIYQQLCMMYTDLLSLVVDIAVRFYKAVHGSAEASASLDMYEVFGETIKTFRERRDAVTRSIWMHQSKSGDVDIDALNRWLAPQDSVICRVALDHTLIAEEMAEYTCLWLHDQLAKFVKSDNRTLLMTGGPSSGKTTLAASLAERLQRPVGRKPYTTLFFSVSAAPSQATSLTVVQVLLHQLLYTRIGDMHLYNTVTRAYEDARHTADPVKYEALLWSAFEEALRTTSEQSSDTLVVVDGLDELAGAQSSGGALLQRLVGAVDKSKATKLVAFARDVKLPSGSMSIQRAITPSDTHSDIHEVVLKKLASSQHFRSKSGREQDSIISRIASVADGSFTWALLTCEVLLLEKTAEDFTKAVSNFQSPKLTIDDLVHVLITRLQPSEDARMLLSWLVYAARPLTYQEIQCLYAINVSTRSKTDRSVDVHQTVGSLAPLLVSKEDVVSIRHGAARPAILNLLKSSKIGVPLKDVQTDLFIRVLTYAKASLAENGEPTLDDTDRTVVDSLFARFPLLEYTVRYWIWHLHSSASGKTPDVKNIPELDKAFPSSTTMPILEWLCWDDQFPGAKEVEFHETAARLRKQILTEKHPAVLQSYINAACYFEVMEDWSRAGPLWFTISTIGRDVLSVSHPVVVESAMRFLRYTESRITNKRTDITTQRESVLILLITAYERQYGMHSDVVIQTRQHLVELYKHINEHERANEVLKVIHGDSGITERRDTGMSRGTTNGQTNGQLRVSLGRTKSGNALEGYDEGIFVDDDEEEETTALTNITQVDAIIKEIERHVAVKEFVQAEQLYVDLLQRISQACRSTSNVEWHAKKIDVFQSYANYLEKQERRTEAVSLTTSLWRDYQHSELSFSEAIVSKLNNSARFLKSMSEYTAALSIYKHASSFFRSVKKEDSRSFTEIEEEMTAVSSQALSQTSRDVSSQTASTSESSQYEMFQVLISNKTKVLDSSTMTLATSLSRKYVEQQSWSQAVSVIESTLSRTWSSFLSTSVHEVTLASAFQIESVQLIEQLAVVYKQQRLFAKAEDIYVRLFRAALSSPKDQPLLDKAKQLLIDFYTQRGSPDKAIFVYQELLAVYRRVYGPDHEKTISVLYELGSRCHTHARNHPYWIEYYQQVVTTLNKNSTTVHAKAMDAAVIVAQCYWEERRSSDAVSLYAVIWNTFVSSHKEFKPFKEEHFVRNLYERYYQSLEETTADFATLRKVTAEYRETTKAVFGANSTLAVESTLALARVSQSSESHMEESIALYEEAYISSARSVSTSSSSSHMEQSDLRQALATMYRKRIFHSSSSASSEMVSKATSMYEGQLKEVKSKHTYSHEETLNSVRELSMLYVRQGKTESASKELNTAVLEIVQHETSSQKMYEAAQSLVSTYQAANLSGRCVSLVEELQYQLVTREKRSSSSFSVVESSRASLTFVAAMAYYLRKDTSISLTEIIASLTAESVMYREFKHLSTSNASLDKVIVAAAPLRHLCQYWKHVPIVEAVEHECVQLFIRRDASSVQLLSKDSPRIFIIGILDHLGGRKCNDFVRSVILASNKNVKNLIGQNKFADAHDVVKMAFMYAQYRNGYRGAKGISRGFELASYLDGRGENKCSDPQLRKKLLQLSNDIIKDVLKICKEQNVNIAQVSLRELNELIALLGEQQDYATLESLLSQLWSTREAQKTWSPDVLTAIGRHLICARYLAGHPIKAIRLCEDIAYNFRRVHGVAHPTTLESYELLAQLYTSTAQSYQRDVNTDKANAGLAADYFRKAILVHEDVLRWVVSEATGGEVGDDNDDEEDTAASILADHGVKTDGAANGDSSSYLDAGKRSELIAKHMRLLKLAVQRHGSWPKEYATYEQLNAQLFRVFPEALKGYDGVEKWQLKSFGSGKAEAQAGAFDASSVGTWEVLVH